MSEEVDLTVVKDHQRAERIIKALEHAGIHHVEYWPEHMLDGGMRVHHTQDEVGYLHIRVREGLRHTTRELERSNLPWF